MKDSAQNIEERSVESRKRKGGDGWEQKSRQHIRRGGTCQRPGQRRRCMCRGVLRARVAAGVLSLPRHGTPCAGSHGRVCAVGTCVLWACQERKAGRPHHELRPMATHHHRCLGTLGKAHQMPGIRALVEDAILTHTAPVGGVTDGEGVADRSIGHRDGASTFGHQIVPTAHHGGIDRLAHIVASPGVVRLFGCSIALGAGSGLQIHDAGAPSLLARCSAMSMTDHPLADVAISRRDAMGATSCRKSAAVV